MKYKLIITEEAKIDIASFLRFGDKAEAKKVSALLDELREHPYTVQVNRKFCGETGPVIGLVASIKKTD